MRKIFNNVRRQEEKQRRLDGNANVEKHFKAEIAEIAKLSEPREILDKLSYLGWRLCSAIDYKEKQIKDAANRADSKFYFGAGIPGAAIGLSAPVAASIPPLAIGIAAAGITLLLGGAAAGTLARRFTEVKLKKESNGHMQTMYGLRNQINQMYDTACKSLRQQPLRP